MTACEVRPVSEQKNVNDKLNRAILHSCFTIFIKRDVMRYREAETCGESYSLTHDRVCSVYYGTRTRLRRPHRSPYGYAPPAPKATRQRPEPCLSAGAYNCRFTEDPPRPARRALPAPRPVPRPPRPPRTWLRTPTVRSSLRRPVLSQRRGRGETRLVSRYARSAWEVKRLHSAALSG